MNELYFVNEKHSLNYKKVKLLFPQANESTEYQATCYILAVPMIYQNVNHVISNQDGPVTWILDWEEKYAIPKYDDETGEEYEERENKSLNYDLTGSMQQLGKLSLNLWNSYENFNLMDCLTSVDDNNLQVVKCAIDIRVGLYKGQ